MIIGLQIIGLFIPIFIMMSIYIYLRNLTNEELEKSVPVWIVVCFGLCLLIFGFTMGTIVMSS